MGSQLGRRLVAIMFVVAIASAALVCSTARAQAATTFLPMAGVNDICYDDARGILYATSGSQISRYDVADGTWLDPFVVAKGAGGIVGIDLSPDGNTIAVTDLVPSAGSNHVYLVDAGTGSWRDVALPISYLGESGAWAVAWAYDDTLLVTCRYPGSGWAPLWHYDSRTGLMTQPLGVWGVRQDSDLSASGDRTLISWAESNISDGRWGMFDSLSGAYIQRQGYTNGTSNFNYAAAASRDGKQSTILGGTTAYVYDDRGATRRDIGNVVGAKYSPTADVLYLARNGSSFVDAHDTKTLAVIKSYDFGATFSRSVGGTYGWPRMAVSRDNTLLFARVPGGIAFKYTAPAVLGKVRSTFRGDPIGGATVELWRQSGGLWSQETTLATLEDGSWVYATENTTTPLRVRITDPTGINAPQWVGGLAVESARDFTPGEPPAHADATLTVVSPATISGAVHSTWKDRALSGARVVLYDDAESQSAIATTTAGADGSYTFPNLGAGSFRVGFSDPGGNHVDQYFSAKSTLDDASPIRLASPEPYSADATLTFTGFKIRGTVTSSFRSVPVTHALIELWRSDGHGWVLEDTTTAGADGSWIWTTDTTGTTHVRVTDPSGAHDPLWWGGADSTSATDVIPAREASAQVLPLTLNLSHPSTICGVVRSSSHGQTLAGVRVELYQNSDGYPSIGSTVTAADGSYRFEGLGLTGYRIGYSDPALAHDPIFWRNANSLGAADVLNISAPSTASADVTMPFVPTYVGGTVVSSWLSKPIQGAAVEVWRQTGAEWSLDATTSADDSGAWNVSLETTDPVRIYVSDPLNGHEPQWYGGGSLQDATDLVPTRRAAHPLTTTLTLTHGATIAGTLYSSWQHRPIPGAIASIYYDDGSGLRAVASTRTAGNGSYQFTGVGAATVCVGFVDPNGAHEPNLSSANPIVTAYDGLFVHDETLQRIPSKIQGTVLSSYDSTHTDVPNPPITGARVEVYRKVSGIWSLVATTSTDADGAWQYTAMDPSPLRVFASDPGGMHDSGWYGGTSLATAKNISPIAETLDAPWREIVLNLARPARIHGTVRDAVTRAPLQHVDAVLVAAGSDDSWVDWAETGADGSYSFDGIPGGSYNLLFFGGGDLRYEDQYFSGASSQAAATVVTISTPSDRMCDMDLQPWVMTPTFDPVAFIVGSDYPNAGQPIHLRAGLWDEYDDPVTDASPVLQSSANGSSWVTESVPATCTPDGNVEATFTAPAAGVTCYYRFAVKADEFHHAAYSNSVWMTSQVPVYWFSRPNLPGTFYPHAGVPVQISAKLQDARGFGYPNRRVKLWVCATRVGWYQSSIPVSSDPDGTYRAEFAPDCNSPWASAWVSCRFVDVESGWSVVSDSVSMSATVSPQVHLEDGGIGALNRAWAQFPCNAPVTMLARLTTTETTPSSGFARVQTSTDGITWVDPPSSQFVLFSAQPATRSNLLAVRFPGSHGRLKLRLVWVSDDQSLSTVSDTVTYATWVPAVRPVISATQHRNKKFRFSGSTVALAQLFTVQRKSGSQWRTIQTLLVKNATNGVNIAHYVVQLKYGTTGSYRINARSVGDRDHVQSPATPWTAFTVK